MKQTLRILMLEDNVDDAELILATLSDEGINCDARRIESRTEFMDALGTQAFDLILSDCSLPSFDGLSALRIAHAVAPDIPFIFVSGTIGEEVAIESLKTGATDYVLKHKLSRLASAVRRAIMESEERAARQDAERARVQAESLLRALFDQMAVGVLVAAMDGRFVRANIAARAMFGYDENEWAGLTIDRLLEPDAGSRNSFYDDLREGRLASHETELRYRRKDGTNLWGRTVISVIYGDSTQSFFVHLIQDITERRELERRFLETQKMEVVGRLAAGIAHDFNNVLTIINGYTDLILTRLGSEDSNRRDLQEVRRAGDRAAKLTQRLLNFSRRQPAQTTAVDLNLVINGLGYVLQPITGEQIRVSTDLDPQVTFVNGDQTQIEQIVMNLAINARDAMPEGGELKISTQALELDILTASSLQLRPARYAVVSVVDTGHGMDDAVKERIFEPFFTTKEVGKGTGLGLWMVREIIRQNGGAITVDSSPGAGTSFRIYLPEANSIAALKGEPTLAAPAGKGETVLVAEDERAVAELLRQTLSAAGYRVLVAGDANGALAISDREQGRIHLLVTDIAMPGMSGHELAAEMAARRPGIGVLCISGHSEQTPPKRWLTNWAFLRKPFTPDTLLNQVRRILDAAERRTILVVDDDAGVRRLVADVLRLSGHLIHEANNGRQAIRQLREKPIDLMITDLVMPDQEGIETISAARREFPNLRIVAMSGGFGERFLTIAKRLGAHETLQKPFDESALIDLLARVFRTVTPAPPGPVTSEARLME
jgi:PAS domain S-box-containing protein